MTLDLTRTAAALTAYDAEHAKPMPDVLSAAISKIALEEKLGQEVGRAYGLDTADRNNLATCEECIRPGKAHPDHPDDESFVRRMVREHGPEASP